MNNGFPSKLAILIIAMGLLVSTVSAFQFDVYVYDGATNQPVSDATVTVKTGSVQTEGKTDSKGTYTFDIPSDLGMIYVVAAKDHVGFAMWKGEFTDYVRLDYVRLGLGKTLPF
jgi:uncharacterized protein YfaS (alpha-2-macroglobulin family)